ncbi:MAG: glycogen/starch/alpha-glucan phosphorylase [Lachnospirales bacterium]
MVDILQGITKDDFKVRLIENVKNIARKNIEQASNQQIYEGLAYTIRDIVSDKWIATHDVYTESSTKVLYYLSMEFLMGRFLGNALINLTLDEKISEALNDLGLNLNEIEDAECDPGLGNGGLGRLAACFLDSLATLELPAYGCGIRYKNGLFEQRIENGYQVEYPDNWLKNVDSWGVRRPEYKQIVKFGGNVVSVFDEKINGYRFELENYDAVNAIPFDYPVIGYDNNTVNTLRLWDAEAVNRFDLESFNEGNYNKAVADELLAKTLVEVLYPADEHVKGKELRLKQQYFFNSATIGRAIGKVKELGKDLHELDKYVVFQLNDTHPAVTVAELMRVLIDENYFTWDEAWEVTKKCCAYTNHTIMVEALEKWPIELFSRVLPRIYMIVEEINKRFCGHLIERFGNDPQKIRKMAIVADGEIRMAHLAIVGSFSVNGVARLHTEILKAKVLKDFYEIYPEKFNNKTNGITQRRWLLKSNPRLSKLISSKIGNGYAKDLSELEKLLDFVDDDKFVNEFIEIKKANKRDFADYVKANMGVDIDPESIYDVQIKRLHEYKRQLMNILHIMYLYNEIRENPNIDMVPRTFIFGAKASAAYKRAKLIIKLINSVAEKVNNDPVVRGRIKVVFLENYRVSLAEHIFPASDISEQISTASKEASGTGNMKFMLNGAITLGTLDGANVEIVEEVGEENCFIFGMKSEEVIEQEQNRTYSPWDEYNLNGDIRKVLTQLINGTFDPDTELFREIYEALLNGYEGSIPDQYFVLKDFEAYKDAQKEVEKLYRDEKAWAKATITNVAKSGKFSSDRTIAQYSEEVWKLQTTKIEDVELVL